MASPVWILEVDWSGYEAQVLADNPVLYWRLGEASGTVAEAKIGSDGDYVNAPTLGIAGPLADFDTAVTFNGSDECAELASTPVSAAPWSVECWVKSANLSQQKVIVALGADDGGVSIAQGNVGGASADIQIIRHGLGWVDSTINFADTNTWYHIVATFDGTTLVVYVNGSSVYSGATTFNAPTARVSVGCQWTTPAGARQRFFGGTIDEVAIYNTVLSATRVAAHYQTPGSGQDITGDTLAVETRRGRDYASQLTGRATAGRLSAVLDNRDGVYSRFNTTGALYGKLLPGRRVRLRTTSPTATLWTGWLESVIPEVGRDHSVLARLEASGALLQLQGKNISPAANAGAATGTIVGAILDAVGWPAGDRIIDAGQTTTSRWFVQDKDALTSMREIEETELGFLYEGLAWDFVFEDRHHRLKTDHLTSQATFSDAAGAARPYSAIAESDPLREIYNEVMAQVENYSVASLAVLWTLTGETPTLSPGTSRTWWANYPNSSSGGASGAYVDAWTTPVVGTDITQTGVANGDIAVAVNKFATAMQITITNNHASATATLTLVQARGTAVTKGNPAIVQSVNEASQTSHGKRTYKLPAAWLPDTNTAQAFTDYVVGRYGDPQPILTIELPSNRDATLLAEALGRAIGDRVTIVATGNANLGIDADFFIEAIGHRIDQGNMRLITTFDLSPIAGDSGYWVLGTSTLGVDTKLGY